MTNTEEPKSAKALLIEKLADAFFEWHRVGWHRHYGLSPTHDKYLEQPKDFENEAKVWLSSHETLKLLSQIEEVRKIVEREVLHGIANALPSDCDKAKRIIRLEAEGKMDWSD